MDDAIFGIFGFSIIVIIILIRVIKNKCEMIESLKTEIELVKKDLEDMKKCCPLDKEIIFNSEGDYSII